MPRAVVHLDVTPTGQLGPSGADAVEIRLAANPGLPARTVTKAASGGELSRVMLAIEVATAAEVCEVPTFVFDEVDAGVGGRAALDVGARLAELADTPRSSSSPTSPRWRHTPTGTSSSPRPRTVTSRPAASSSSMGEERVAELARMMAGAGTEAALENARELLDRVRAAGVTDPGHASWPPTGRGAGSSWHDGAVMAIRVPNPGHARPDLGVSGPARVDRADEEPHQAAAARATSRSSTTRTSTGSAPRRSSPAGRSAVVNASRVDLRALPQPRARDPRRGRHPPARRRRRARS